MELICERHLDRRCWIQSLRFRDRNYMFAFKQQESPPAWTQEPYPYRPPLSKYSLCCSVSRMGYPILTWMWYSPPPCQLDGGTPSPVGWMGVPPQLDGVNPPPSPISRTGLPPVGRGGGQSENITFRDPSDAGGKNVNVSYKTPNRYD